MHRHAFPTPSRIALLAMRSVAWRRSLGLLPSAAESGADCAAAATLRREYVQLRTELLHDPRADEGDLATNNPLCANPDSSWARFFKNEARRHASAPGARFPSPHPPL
jgi:hypothetical protein